MNMIQVEDALGKVTAKELLLGRTITGTNIRSISALTSNIKQQKMRHSLLIIRHWQTKKYSPIGLQFYALRLVGLMKIAISQEVQKIQDSAEITTGKVTIRATALIGAKFVSATGSRNHAAL